jgi:precorrin-2 dehydrogenase / sirohydrochlorin ferrochelatase
VKYYPIFLDIKDKKCVIVGGGEVAARKAERLLDCGAEVYVISPKLTSELAEMEEQNLICYIDTDYTNHFLDGAALVIGATNDEAMNARISRDARAKGIPVNIVDDPNQCDFILPSLMQRGDLTIAISTAGKSPALARHLREELELKYGSEYEIFLDILGKLRVRMAKKENKGKNWFKAMLDAGILDSIKNNDIDKVKEIIKQITGEEIDVELS